MIIFRVTIYVCNVEYGISLIFPSLSSSTRAEPCWPHGEHVRTETVCGPSPMYRPKITVSLSCPWMKTAGPRVNEDARLPIALINQNVPSSNPMYASGSVHPRLFLTPVEMLRRRKRGWLHVAKEKKQSAQ